MGRTPRVAWSLVLLSLVLGSGLSVVVSNIDFPGAVWVAANSSNYSVSDREANGLRIRWIVIHDIEGTTSACLAWFQDSAAKASSHYVVDYDGTLYQMVSEKDIAWHAGNWDYNQHSIGIEHAGYADINSFTDEEYRASARLVAYLAKKYNVSIAHPDGIAPATSDEGSGIIGHYQVPDPYNTTLGGGASHHYDPGAYWNWTYYLSLVALYYQNATLPSALSEREGERPGTLAGLPLALVLSAIVGFGAVATIVFLVIRQPSDLRKGAQEPENRRVERQRGPKT